MGVIDYSIRRRVAALEAALRGVPVVRRFPFAHDTPGILAGAAIYTPTVGDILLDGWIEINTAWDGTTPRADILWSDTHLGFFSTQWDSIDLTQEDIPFSMGGNLLTGVQMSSLQAGDILADASGVFRVPAIESVPSEAMFLTSQGHTDLRCVPSKFVTADPFRIVVSQDGSGTGADPGSTHGAAILYLVTATPA